MDVAFSKNGVPIRLTDERWLHIVENHDDVAGYYDEVLETIEDPEIILRGHSGALIAVRALGRRKYLAVDIQRTESERWLRYHRILHVASF